MRVGKHGAIRTENMRVRCLDAQAKSVAGFGRDVAMNTYHHRPKPFNQSVDIRVRAKVFDDICNCGQVTLAGLDHVDMFRAYSQFDRSGGVC